MGIRGSHHWIGIVPFTQRRISNFHGVQSQALWNEAQLADNAEPLAVDVRGNRQSTELMDRADHLFDRKSGGPDQQPAVCPDHAIPVIDHQLRAECLRIILAGKVLVDYVLQVHKSLGGPE